VVAARLSHGRKARPHARIAVAIRTATSDGQPGGCCSREGGGSRERGQSRGREQSRGRAVEREGKWLAVSCIPLASPPPPALSFSGKATTDGPVACEGGSGSGVWGKLLQGQGDHWGAGQKRAGVTAGSGHQTSAAAAVGGLPSGWRSACSICRRDGGAAHWR
jgi:hypothetical protein